MPAEQIIEYLRLQEPMASNAPHGLLLLRAEWREEVISALAAAPPAAGTEHREREVLRAERDQACAQRDRGVSILAAIHGLLTPEDVRLPDGRVFEFANEKIEREMLRALCAEIRAIPDKLPAAGMGVQQLRELIGALLYRFQSGTYSYGADSAEESHEYEVDICNGCGKANSHADGCIVPRIEAALAAADTPPKP